MRIRSAITGVHGAALAMLIVVALAHPAPAQTAPAWPTVTAEMRPWTRWWWQGSAVNKADLTANLDAYRKVGLGGVELTPIYGVKGAEPEFIPYLSPRWVEMLEHTIAESKRLGLGVDMANGTGWPFGGPQVGEADEAKYVAHKTYALHGGERLRDTIAFVQTPLVRAVTGRVEISQLKDPIAMTPNLQALAIDQVRFPKPLPLQALMAYSKAGAVVDLTSRVKNGLLGWTAPAGEWTLYALFQGFHGKQVERAAPGGEGNVIDHFAPGPIAHYLARFDRAFAGHDVRGVRAFFNDSYEVDDASGQGDWTPKLLDEFKARRGYDLRAHLPALFDGGTSDTARRVLSDYRQTVSDLMLDGFTRTWAGWAHARGGVIRNQAHGSPANILDLYAASDIPETEGTEMTRIKFGTSAAHVTGKRLASAEAATWLGEHFLSKLSDVRTVLDNYFLGGVNHVLYHGTAYSPASEPWPGRLFYAAVEFNPQNSWWNDFAELNAYATRVQSFMQSGQPDNDVLLYFPIFDRYAERPRAARGRGAAAAGGGFAAPGTTPPPGGFAPPAAGAQGQTSALLEHFDAIPPFDSSAFHVAADSMLARGYSYDYVSDRQLASVRAEGSQLVSANARHRTVLVPESHFIPLETMEKLVSLARGGATIAFYRGVPEDVAGLNDLARRRARLEALKTSLHLAPASNAGVRRAVVGRGAVLVSDVLNALLDAAGARREPAIDQGLQLIRRRESDGATYFIVNRGTKSVDGWVPLTATARSAAIYAPMHAQSGIGRVRSTATGSEVYLQFPVGASRIVRTYDHVVSGAPWPYTESAGTALPVTGSWTLTFLTGGPTLPPDVVNAPLGSWTDLAGEEVKNFSGTARYRVSFARPSAPAGITSWRLDLGEVHESAHVTLNGKDVGTFVGPWWRVEIPAEDLRDTNVLDVAVSNLMANRIADLDRRGVPWKKFYNTNFPSRLATNRAPDGLFSAATWTPEPSGLTGPVTLTPLKAKQF
ncbi:MAG TPA: glycosyl hydrolase [Gemmatimonadaceae bacterium]|nr:glycosyl hydrolase [Gemmatimonadaceae bacterium]